MNHDELAEKEYELTENLGAVVSELQVSLIYEDVLDNRDYSRVIKTLDSIAEALYREGREALEGMEDNKNYREIGNLPDFSGKPERVTLNQGNREWIIMNGAGELCELLEEHQENIEDSDPRYEGMAAGSKLRSHLEDYERLREAAAQKGVYNFEKLEERLIDEEFGETIVEGEDAEVFWEKDFNPKSGT